MTAFKDVEQSAYTAPVSDEAVQAGTKAIQKLATFDGLLSDEELAIAALNPSEPRT